MFTQLVFLAGIAAAVDTQQLQWANSTPGPGPHGSGFAFNGHYGNHNNHEHGHNHKNPWYHTVVHHKSADDYHSDPWEQRGFRGGDANRATWYSPYQQFSPPQIAYVPTVSHATFARCYFGTSNNESDDFLTSEIKIGQLKGKAPVVKMTLTAGAIQGTSYAGYIEFQIHQYGTFPAYQGADEDNLMCSTVGEEYNPLNEVDKYGRNNPFQDPLRGKLERVNLASTFDFNSDSPMNLLQNLEGKESILGRSMVIYTLATPTDVTSDINTTPGYNGALACCIISRDSVPVGFGPKPIPYPLTTHSHTYASYGKNVAYPSNVTTPTHTPYKNGHSYGNGSHQFPNAQDYHHTITSLSGR